MRTGYFFIIDRYLLFFIFIIFNNFIQKLNIYWDQTGNLFAYASKYFYLSNFFKYDHCRSKEWRELIALNILYSQPTVRFRQSSIYTYIHICMFVETTRMYMIVLYYIYLYKVLIVWWHMLLDNTKPDIHKSIHDKCYSFVLIIMMCICISFINYRVWCFFIN